ncbi:hypothetical protein [Actinomadura harenae]|uniref:Uncharacterized protein n=1 Tax=Actinomadura harenae TaxID=2483351 RepID=A0A3M2LPY7_9ACTN|nr:hypothetical protein [Actinomadura harenae]RMI39554.1 hypothetical protein EBO15_29280 [Actinomadura harenae]
MGSRVGTGSRVATGSRVVIGSRRLPALFLGVLCLVATSAADCKATGDSGGGGRCGGGNCTITLNRSETHKIGSHRATATVATAVACLSLTHLIATHVVCEAGGETFQRRFTKTAATADADGQCLQVRFDAPKKRHWRPVSASQTPCG